MRYSVAYASRGFREQKTCTPVDCRGTFVKRLRKSIPRDVKIGFYVECLNYREGE